MDHIKRTSLGRWLLPAVTAISLLASAPALAVDSLKILVPANPGGGWDQTGRALGQAMQTGEIVKKVQIDNKGGAAGTIGLAQFVNSSKGKGDALLVGGSVMVGGIALNKSPVSLSQVTPIARLTGEYDVLVVPANSPIKSVKDLVAKFKADPGSVSWGGGSAGGTDHIIVGMIAQATGVDVSKINYIPFAGGGEAQAAILGGHVTVGLSGYNEFEGQIKTGKMRPLAVTSDKRLPGLDIPTLKEQGVDVVLANWRGVFGAPGISDAQKKELIAVVEKTAKSKTWQETLAKNGWADSYLAGDAFKDYLDKEIKETEKIIAGLGLVKK
ncbi:MAG TPA: tripartite tricarboxylate transporter substrate binding protein [Noviherbaspirillum sp.]|jgi:putative tricarboxylic transport membrane protein|uniref:Bug family tripartite tricarboxylate transporter substrate binding protein n=1 Tax=Noviherbaspirillum sp. TaxID=1926288 RepID=UPI002DDCC3E7|nr:tripartite tricarboxylate transporter substrate binding protein [Noviherbaspirillum sp.]HEV2608965.1 tripartite tricarboxylate transporter substrate binding protein [Noviherbaspirillum sp.]